MRLNAIAAVLAVNVALAGALAYLWSDADRLRWPEPSPLPPALDEAIAAPPAEPADVARFRETIERPLFAVNRKPAPRKDQAAAEQAADALADVRLLGTYGAGDKGGIVVVRAGKVERVAIGDSIGGWKVAGGGAGRAAELVRADGQRKQLEMALNNAAPAVPTEPGKGGTPDAADGQAAVGQPAGGASAAPAATQRATTSRGRTAWGGAASPEVRQRRLDQINQRRAARGQQPLPSR